MITFLPRRYQENSTINTWQHKKGFCALIQYVHRLCFCRWHLPFAYAYSRLLRPRCCLSIAIPQSIWIFMKHNFSSFFFFYFVFCLMRHAWALTNWKSTSNIRRQFSFASLHYYSTTSLLHCRRWAESVEQFLWFNAWMAQKLLFTITSHTTQQKAESCKGRRHKVNVGWTIYKVFKIILSFFIFCANS